MGAGSFYVRKRPERRTTYEWSLARQEDVRVFLETIEPHLKIKRERARTALEEIGVKRAKRAIRSAL
jgi:hypothetical protein